jgi:hypothetical protein
LSDIEDEFSSGVNDLHHGNAALVLCLPSNYAALFEFRRRATTLPPSAGLPLRH